jgi:imidazolonepropionase-like amidohydrolase
LFNYAFFSNLYNQRECCRCRKSKILPNQTIVITNDLITTVKSSKKVKIPVNADVIDGNGKYIFPGLTDAHIHFFQNGGLYTRPDAIDLRQFMPHEKDLNYAHNNMENVLHRYLQNGITNVIDVGSNKKFLKQREGFKDNLNIPSIYMTGPLLTTYEPNVYVNLKDEEPFSLVTSVEDGISMVKDQLPFKPDFIKIWYITTADGLGIEASARKNLPIIKAIIDEAHKHNLRVAVHATQRIPAQLAVENGCDFLVHSIDDEIVKDDFVQLLKKNQTFLCPTLNGFAWLYGHIWPTNYKK